MREGNYVFVKEYNKYGRYELLSPNPVFINIIHTEFEDTLTIGLGAVSGSNEFFVEESFDFIDTSNYVKKKFKVENIETPPFFLHTRFRCFLEENIGPVIIESSDNTDSICELVNDDTELYFLEYIVDLPKNESNALTNAHKLKDFYFNQKSVFVLHKAF